MDAQTVKTYFENAKVVADYAEAAEKVGLWNSEKIIFEKYLSPDMNILELGCGAGRVSLGLWRDGFKKLTATDFSESMVCAARAIFDKYEADVKVLLADATKLPFADESFDAAIFAFNGLMQIPKAKNREIAISEIRRVLRRGGIFIFTTHDRATPRNSNYWEAEKKQWEHSVQDARLDDFGDLFYKGEHGNVFIHSPIEAEIQNMLKSQNYKTLYSARRIEIADETPLTQEFSDDCVFRVVIKDEL